MHEDGDFGVKLCGVFTGIPNSRRERELRERDFLGLSNTRYSLMFSTVWFETSGLTMSIFFITDPLLILQPQMLFS